MICILLVNNNSACFQTITATPVFALLFTVSEAQGVVPQYIWPCPACEQETYVIEDGRDICYTCRHAAPVVECPQCSKLCFAEENDRGGQKAETRECDELVLAECLYVVETFSDV